MSKYTITPWRTQTDLLQVRQQLYSSYETSTDSRRGAVDRVMAWKLRGNLPHAVESTALLVDAILHHDTTANSSFSVRAVYSAAFSRFVTGFCDIGRHKERTLEPSSMLDIARQIDMPVDFVALRHEATHEELPGLQRLVNATQQALTWLWKVYWSRLEEPEDVEAVITALPSTMNEISAILREFRRSRRDALRNRIQQPSEQIGELEKTREACVEIGFRNQERTEAVARILVEKRLIFPSSRELGSPLEGAYLIWDDLLQDISDRLSGFLAAFVRSLLLGLTSASTTDPQRDLDEEALAMWLLHILSGEEYFALGRGNKRSLYVEAMKWCCLHPGHWTERIARELLNRGDGAFQADWNDLFEASLVRAEPMTPEAGMPEKALENRVGEFMDTEQITGMESREVNRVAEGWRRAVAPISVPVGIVQ